MGNNPSQALAAASAKSQFNSAVSDVQQSLGIGGQDGGKKDGEVVVPPAIGCANRKEQKQRHIDRQKEYEMKQRERMERKEALENKWGGGTRQSGGENDVAALEEFDEDKDKELKAKIAAMKKQSASMKDKNKPKKSGLFGRSK